MLVHAAFRENMDPAPLIQKQREFLKSWLEETADIWWDMGAESRVDDATGKVPGEGFVGETNIGGTEGMAHMFRSKNGGRKQPPHQRVIHSKSRKI